MIYTKYIDINPKIKILLEQEKMNFVNSSNKYPNAFFSANKEYNCYIITAPWECEAMQIVGEFNREPGLKNLTNIYAVVGDQTLDVEKRVFLNLINNSFYLGLNDQEYLKAIYNRLLVSNNNPDYSDYINYCKKMKPMKRHNRIKIH